MRNAKRQNSGASTQLPTALWVAANIFIFGPFVVYHGNPEEFEIGFLGLLSLSVVACLVVTSILVVIGTLMPSRLSSFYSALLLATGVLMWTQGSFLLGEYGVFDGRGIDWGESLVSGWLDLSLWIAVIVGCVVFHRQVTKVSSTVSWLMITLQAVLLVGLGATSGREMWIKEYVPPDHIPADMLKFSASRNIIHFVFDSFQTDIFRELVAEQNLEKKFQGFVLFQENMGVSPYTSFSIPAVFSGQVYDGIDSPSSYFQDSMKNGFHNRLFEEGFTVNLIPQLPMRVGEYTHYYKIPSVHAGSWWDLALANGALLLDVSLFRQVPHVARKRVYNDGNWIISPLARGSKNVPYIQQKRFFAEYVQNIEVGGPSPTYHFIHLMPPHPPYVTNFDGSYADKVLPNTRENYKNQARSILAQFVEFLERLESLDLYETAIIIVQGDHGSQILPVVDGNTVDTYLPRVAPLLAVKPAGEEKSFKTSDAQTSLMDIPATVMDLTGLEAAYSGESVFKIDQNLNRPRPFIIYAGGEDPPRLTKYIVEGSVFDRSSWREEGHSSVTTTSPMYRYGDEVRFGMGGNSDPFLGKGWSPEFQMGSFCWSDGHNANLRFLVKPAEHDVRLSVRIIPYVYPGIVPKQTVFVSVSGREVAEWTADEEKIIRFETIIPKGLITSENLQLSFDLPDAVRPKDIGTGGDARILGIAMVSLTMELVENSSEGARTLDDLESSPEYRYGSRIRFGRGGNAGSFLGEGWSDGKQGGICWSDGYRATARFTARPPEGDLVMDVSFIPFTVDEKVPAQRVRVSVNGTAVADWTAKSQKMLGFRAAIPHELVEDGIIDIVFEFPDAVRPVSIGAGPDQRTLAIAMHSLRFSLSSDATPP